MKKQANGTLKKPTKKVSWIHNVILSDLLDSAHLATSYSKLLRGILLRLEDGDDLPNGTAEALEESRARLERSMWRAVQITRLLK